MTLTPFGPIEISRHDWMEWKPVGDLINAARQKSGK